MSRLTVSRGGPTNWHTLAVRMEDTDIDIGRAHSLCLQRNEPLLYFWIVDDTILLTERTWFNKRFALPSSTVTRHQLERFYCLAISPIYYTAQHPASHYPIEIGFR